MAVRVVEENEDGFGAIFEIITALLYLGLITPTLLIVGLVSSRRHRGRHRA